MNSLVHRPHYRTPSLLGLAEYWELEKQVEQRAACSREGALLEYETLELRVNPPNIIIENRAETDYTHIAIDSANRPGTLVEVVQHFTELGLDVRKARISSDGGWFVDSFNVQEANGKQITSQSKLQSIRQMLNVQIRTEPEAAANGDETDDSQRVETTVFEVAGQDKAGLLAQVTQLLTSNGCNVRSAAVWTHHNRAAFVLSVTEKGQPVSDNIKLQRLKQILMEQVDDNQEGLVNIKKVRGEVHHDRRLHQLLLQEEMREWSRGPAAKRWPSLTDDEDSDLGDEALWAGTLGGTNTLAVAASSPADSVSSIHGENFLDPGDGNFQFRSPKHSKPVVTISDATRRGYWLVAITCKDRNKLLFDTVCTLADMSYDVYHATVDSNKGIATQEYYIKPRHGSIAWDEGRAAKLVAMMEAAIQRRFPKGLKVHVCSVDRFGCLAELTRVLHAADLSVTRAKVKTSAVNKSSGHTFYVMTSSGNAPDRQKVEALCSRIGGKLVEVGEEERSLSPADSAHRFSFSFLHRKWQTGWGGPDVGSPRSSIGSL
ncbi:hypothetical protein WJX73_001778 [Symbiochloris irregularis]|uniref:ACT domain-containing protein n=1 Tax=Symbiochloris irregularis TaxID=706552 RepID=A0AAW1PR58_9CHLO